jgi:hypothetical protein
MGPVDLRPRLDDFGFVKGGGETLKGMFESLNLHDYVAGWACTIWKKQSSVWTITI